MSCTVKPTEVRPRKNQSGPRQTALYEAAATLVALVLLAACGAPRAYPDTASASAENSPPMLSPSPTKSAYVSYVSPKWKYSFEYPSSWFDVPDLGAIPGDKYFATINTQSPEALGPDDLWLTVNVDEAPAQACTALGALASPAPLQVSLDSEVATEVFYSNGAEVAATHNNWCYRFVVLGVDLNAYRVHSAEVAHILATFKFNR